jgi:hypothetical protein
LVDLLRSAPGIPGWLHLASHSRLLDIGSGVGQVVLQVQLRCRLAAAVGIECVRDRHESADALLHQLRTRHLPQSGPPSQLQTDLLPYLDQRLDAVRFIHGRIEDHQQLIAAAWHVCLFDAHFHPVTHAIILPLLCSGPPRVVVSCLTLDKIQQLCASPKVDAIRTRFRRVGQLALCTSGSPTTRQAYIYVTQQPPMPPQQMS